jgi:hypothetical protein
MNSRIGVELRLHEWWMQGEQFAPHGSSKERSTHTIRLRRRSQGVARYPRQGLASHFHSITTHHIRPDHCVREQTIHHTDTATSTTGALITAIGLRGRPWIYLLTDMPGHFGPATGCHLFHRGPAILDDLQRANLPPAAGSPLQETALTNHQKHEQYTEHTFIVRRAGALD